VESTKYVIDIVINGIFPSNTYIITDKVNNSSVIIDPGLDWPAINRHLEEANANPIAIIATHGHFDHIGSVSQLKEKYGIPFFIHEADIKVSKSANFYLKIAKLDCTIRTPEADHIFKGKQEIISIDGFNFNVRNFPGHTEGSCVLQIENLLFSGDILYKKGLGFNHFPGEDKGKLRASVKEIFALFPDDIKIYPGHGSAALLGDIKKDNKDLHEFIHSIG
jgi:hydroxyacylglutathione hydrolase